MRISFLLALLLALPAASAQVGIGGQVGSPTGLSLKVGQGRGAVLLAVGWGGGDSVEAEGHYLLRERRLRGSASDARFYFGPGVFLQTDDDRDPDFGLSLGLGLSLRLAPEFEIYGHLSPRLQLVRETDTDLGAALGLRLFL